MMRKALLVTSLALAALMLSALSCDFSTNVAGTAFAPTPPAAPGTPISSGSPIESGWQISAAIQRPGEEHLYTFHGEAGMAVNVDMQSGPLSSLDSFLVLRGPNGAELTRNDDWNGLNSRIDNFVLPETGDYTIAAHGYNYSSTGNYSLVMVMGTPVPTPTLTPTLEPGGGEIAIGSSETASINVAGQVDLWSFRGQAGEVVTIEMRSTGTSYLDPHLELIGPYGNTLFIDDDSGGNLNARITNFVLPESGTYSIQAISLGGYTGTYDLALVPGVPPTSTPLPPTPGPTPTPVDRLIEPGQTMEQVIHPHSGGDRYNFHTNRPVVVEVMLLANDQQFGLSVDLFDPNGFQQTLVDYSNMSPAILLPSVALQTPGDYVFRVMNMQEQIVRYTFRLSFVEYLDEAAGRLVYGQGISGELLYPGQEDHWTFEGRVTDRVIIAMHGSDNLDSFLILRDANGQDLASNDDVYDGNSFDSRIEYTLPHDGEYTIIARGYSGNSFGQYRLHLFRVGG